MDGLQSLRSQHDAREARQGQVPSQININGGINITAQAHHDTRAIAKAVIDQITREVALANAGVGNL